MEGSHGSTATTMSLRAHKSAFIGNLHTVRCTGRNGAVHMRSLARLR
jgi:hypothetical protein